MLQYRLLLLIITWESEKNEGHCELVSPHGGGGRGDSTSIKLILGFVRVFGVGLGL